MVRGAVAFDAEQVPLGKRVLDSQVDAESADTNLRHDDQTARLKRICDGLLKLGLVLAACSRDLVEERHGALVSKFQVLAEKVYPCGLRPACVQLVWVERGQDADMQAGTGDSHVQPTFTTLPIKGTEI